ncbi:hypothetical protein DERF_009046 [Dermatophagoides farinae]|uniref:Uncharacterized protein n=1 Tax=Dermatophagoides farinae TaxID=6954 RepID=A0A922HU33_DERFA|nr:hypothetical protein DERF_009046 [Dermatophagoides farinae]
MTSDKISNKNEDHHKIIVEDEWQKLVQSLNQSADYDELNKLYDRCSNLINEHLHLRDELNKSFDDNIQTALRESNLEFNDDDPIPTLPQLIQNQEQTYDRYQQSKQTLNDITHEQLKTDEQLKSLKTEVKTLRKKRDQLKQTIDEIDNNIRVMNSYLQIHNESIACFFSHINGHLQDCLIENEENSTKEDFCRLSRIILND